MIARWLGNHAYADYVVDSAVIGLLLICLEIIPSNFVVFKVQDHPSWIRSVGAQALVSIAVIATFTTSLGTFGSPFNQYTPWIAVYAATCALKRYLDMRLQSTGRLAHYLRLDALIAGLRLPLLFCCAQLHVNAATSLWMSLAIASGVVQLHWLLTHPDDLQPLKLGLSTASFKAIWDERAAYPGYYLGIVLKRGRDNLMPLLAERFFQQKEELAAFFLAYRGLVFASGQIRILEGIINHKPTMNSVLGSASSRKLLIASIGQALVIGASVVLLLSAGAENAQPLTILILSLITWPSTYLILARAQAYASYRAHQVNAALLAHVVVLLLSVTLLGFAGGTTGVFFAAALLAAECAGYATLRLRSGRKDA